MLPCFVGVDDVFFRFFVMKCTPQIFVSVFVVAALCLAVADTVSAQERINIFDSKNVPPRREVQRQVEQRNLTVLINAGDPENRRVGRRDLMLIALCIGVPTVLIAGLVYWLQWHKKRTEWALNDPMALVKELSLVHQLSEQEKRFLLAVSNRNSLSSPLQLFVEPKFLLKAWEDDTFVSSQPLVRRLLYKLFDISTESGEFSIVLPGMNSETQIYPQSM